MKRLFLLLLAIITLITLGFLIFIFDPYAEFQISNFKFQIFYVFFPLLFLFLFSLCTLLFKSKKHGMLISLFAISYLIFRLNDITHPFFLIILLALFLTVELLVSYRK